MTTEHKDTATSLQSSLPFCSKKGEGGFFVQTKEVERPFFAPAISQKAAVGGGGNARHTPFFQARSQPVIQPKLTINEPGDKYEKEADAMSDRVMRMSVPASEVGDEGMVQTKPLNITAIQRKCASCEEEKKKKPLMRKAEAGNAGMPVSSSFASSLNATKGSGSPLPQGTRNFMENAFSADFSGVKIHTGSEASEMSKGINARAFTYGNEIYFNEGQYFPNSDSGKSLLAHELTHVVQQSTDATKTKPIVYRKEQAFEADKAKSFLEIAILGSKDTFKKLIDAPKEADARFKLIQDLNNVCVPAISQVQQLCSSFSSDKLKSLIPLVGDLSNSLLLIKKWIDGRTGNAKLVDEFFEVYVEADIVREQLGLKDLGLDEAKGFPEREESEAIAERSQMVAATGDFAQAWNVLEKAMEEGIEQWYELAKIEEQQKPTFFEPFLEALLTSLVGNIAGVLVKSCIEVSETEVVKEAIREIVSGTTSDTTQAILGPALASAASEAGSSANIKALLYVRAGLMAICRGQESESVKELNKKVSEGEYDIARVKELENVVRESETKAVERLKIQAATDWVRYVAQSSTIAKRKANKEPGIDDKISGTVESISNTTTDLHDYFGQKEHITKGLVDTFGEGSLEGSSGMLKVSVKLVSGKMNRKALNLYNLNKEMAELILSGDKIKILADVKVPKEVHFEIWEKEYTVAGLLDKKYEAKIAIDESGKIIDYIPPQNMEEMKWQVYLAKWISISNLPVSDFIIE